MSIGFVVSSAVKLIGRGCASAGAGRPGPRRRMPPILHPACFMDAEPPCGSQTDLHHHRAGSRIAITSRGDPLLAKTRVCCSPPASGAPGYSAAPIAPASSSPCADGASAFWLVRSELTRDMYDGVHNRPQLQRLLRCSRRTQGSARTAREDIVAVLAEIDVLSTWCAGLLGNDAEGAAAARAGTRQADARQRLIFPDYFTFTST